MKEAEEAECLVSRFLDFARPLHADIQDVNIKNAVAEVIAAQKILYSKIKYNFIYKDDWDGIVKADQLLLKQALTNVIDNASKASSSDGIVDIGIETINDRLEIYISDNGPGIDPEIGDRIFAPFYSGAPSGTGLGLPLARKILILHDGRLEYKNNSGAGVTFRISLPLVMADSYCHKTEPVSSRG
jgi:signal transduction histidine kinase